MENIVVRYTDPETDQSVAFEARVPFLHKESVGVGLVALQDLTRLQQVVNKTARQYGRTPPAVREVRPRRGLLFINSNWFAVNEFGPINSIFMGVEVEDQFGTAARNFFVMDYIQTDPKNHAWKEAYWKLNSQLGDVRLYGYDAIRSGQLFANRGSGLHRPLGAGVKAYNAEGTLVWDMEVDLGLNTFAQGELQAVAFEDELILITARQDGKPFGHSFGRGNRLVLNRRTRFWNRAMAFWSLWLALPGSGPTEANPFSWWRNRSTENLTPVRLLPFTGQARYWANANTVWDETSKNMIPVGWHIVGLQGGYKGAVAFSEAQRQASKTLLCAEGAFDPVRIVDADKSAEEPNR